MGTGTALWETIWHFPETVSVPLLVKGGNEISLFGNGLGNGLGNEKRGSRGSSKPPKGPLVSQSLLLHEPSRVVLATSHFDKIFVNQDLGAFANRAFGYAKLIGDFSCAGQPVLN
jgi:hypothetical protein